MTTKENARMEAVDNGFIVSWDEVSKPSQGGTYTPMTSTRKQAVFSKDQHEEAMKCLSGCSGMGDDEESSEPTMEPVEEKKEEMMEGE